MKSLVRRAVTAFVAFPIVLSLFWVAGTYELDWLVGIVVSVAGVLAGWEYIQIIAKLGIPQPKEFLMVAIPVFLMLSVLWDGRFALVVGWGVIYFTVVYSFFRKGAREGFFAALANIFGFLYIPVVLSILYFLYRAGFSYLLHFFLIVWGYDTGAYLFGSAFGRHQILPRISLAKTWEGVAGGMVLAIIGAAMLPLFLGDFLRWLPHVVALGVMVGAFAQLGDLFESLFKRAAGVKDTGVFLPGHGGMLDRIDGVLAALPVYLFYMRYLLDLV